jgi:hypothetical protein
MLPPAFKYFSKAGRNKIVHPDDKTTVWTGAENLALHRDSMSGLSSP